MGSRADLPTSYFAAQSRLGRRDERKVANNTRLVRRADDRIAVRLHSTDVVTFYADGSTRLSSGGWQTVTTRDRINRCLDGGWSVGTERGVMYLYRRVATDWRDETPCDRYEWRDGVRVNADGTTDAEPKIKRVYRARAPHHDDCACASCARRSPRGWTSTDYTPAMVGDQGEHVTTPEETLAAAGVDADRWGEFNAKFCALLGGTK